MVFRKHSREGGLHPFLVLRINRGSDTSSSGSFNLRHDLVVAEGKDRWDRSIGKWWPGVSGVHVTQTGEKHG
jgi:hypothetical protein